ncbi:hypothetical protein EDD85DRAFT_381458 [Armillaria nabsnona]|nr:hypothetical protein EDD85DRAFT_381458 [Armillaria nabsnona]
MVFMLVIVMYPATTNTAVIVRTEAVSEVDLTVYGGLRTVRSPTYLIGWVQTYADRPAHLTTGRLSIILKSLGMISGGPRRRMLDCLQSHVNQLAGPSVRAVDGLSRSELKRMAANYGIPFDLNTHTNDLVEDVEEHFDTLACTASEPLEHTSCNERSM